MAIHTDRRIVLASGSPRRRELLKNLGVTFEVCSPDVDETISGAPEEMVYTLAMRKAAAAAPHCSDAIVITADTLVALDGRALGKPTDDREAVNMLFALSGQAHDVLTGLCVTDTRTGRCETRVERTKVYFRELSEADITSYVATGEPRDKAGAYAIQGGARSFVEHYEGSYTNIVGLPLEALEAMLGDILSFDGEAR